MARVALVNLPFQAGIASIAQTSVGPPMGLAYIGAVLRQAGHEVSILDANALRMTLPQVLVELIDLKPQVVGTTAATPSIYMAGELAGLVKRGIGEVVKVVAGGPHPSILPVETLETFPDIDVAVVGEGELIADRLISALSAGNPLWDIPGVAWRDGERVRLNPAAPLAVHLDSIPFPARDLLPNHLYRTIDSWPMTCMVAMRGCPARCVYCNVPELCGRSVRRRSPENVVAEMEEVFSRWRVRFFSFVDDTFTTSKRWVEQLCDALDHSGLSRRVSWSCLTRPDMVDESILKRMKEAGLVRVEFGIESGSPRVLERLGKGAALSQIRRAFEIARKLGLVTMGFAMINIPGESLEEMEATRKEVLSIDPDFLQLSFCTPYPGTRLYEECRREGLLADLDWSHYRFLKTPVIKHPSLDAQELLRIHSRILRSFYLRPSKAARLVSIALRRPSSALSLGRSVLAGLRELLRLREQGSHVRRGEGA